MLIRNCCAASYHAAARWKCWKVLVGRPTLHHEKSTRGRFEYPLALQWRTGSPFVAWFGLVYLVPCRTFSALKMFDTFLEDSQHRGRFAASDAKHCCHSTGVMEKHCENISNVLLGMLNAKCCLSWSKANQTVMPKHLQAEEWFRKQFQTRFVRSSMW